MLKETSLLNIIHCNSHTRQFCLYESEVTVLVAQSCLTVCDSMDYGLPDSFVHGDSPLSMGFSRQEDCSGLPFPSPGNLPDAGIEPGFPALQADSLPTEPEAPTYTLVVLNPAPHYTSLHYPLPIPPCFFFFFFWWPHHS